MNLYLILKFLHIVSATILFGTGIGIAFFMFTAYRSGDRAAFRTTARYVVLADWLFTTPAVVVQLLTGIWLTLLLGISFSSVWFVAVMGLFVLVGMCWLPVVWIQIRLKRLLEDGSDRQFASLMRRWTMLGIVAFAAVFMLFVLMVFKPGVATTIL